LVLDVKAVRQCPQQALPGGYIVFDMTDDDLPLLPGFREMARTERRRQELMAELVAERHAAGLSQAEVADRMGTSQPAVARVEAGTGDVRLSTLERYAAAVGRRLEVRLERPSHDVHKHDVHKHDVHKHDVHKDEG
jgi:predicted XRE-type DNA-binding protein